MQCIQVSYWLSIIKDNYVKLKRKNRKHELYKKIYKEYKAATTLEIWEGVRDNLGKIVNRPKYVTDLGKLIVFPIPSALGAFTGYKMSYVLIELINKYI